MSATRSNLGSLTLLVVDLVTDQDSAGTSLLIAAFAGVGDERAFALIYWELTAAAPSPASSNQGEQLPLADLCSTQDIVIEVAAGSSWKADWIPIRSST